MPQDYPVTPWRLRLAAHLLRQGGILAYPTEAVFGLGCNPLNETAVARLLRIKQRDVSKGVILIADSFARLRPFIGAIEESRLNGIRSDWPGPVTWLLPAAPWVPSWLTGNHASLAMRVTDHPIASALCRTAGMPLVSTSANLSGRAPARTPLQARIRCANEVDMVLHGATGGLCRPTTIRDALSGATLR
jgi:L-threonylcarbamoyladenylate synthase